MKPQRCLACQGENLYDPLGSPRPGEKGVTVDLGGDEGVTIRPGHVPSPFWSMFWPGSQTSVKVHYAVCLACGFVMPYVDDAGLALIQEWDAKEKLPVKPN